MHQNLFTVFDLVSSSYGALFLAPTTGAAIRMFSDLVADADTLYGKHPQDFALYHLGNFDLSSAEFGLLSPPVRVIIGSACLSKEPVA